MSYFDHYLFFRYKDTIYFVICQTIFKGRGGSPWGTPPGGGNGNGSGRGPTPPDIDAIIRDIQDKINKFLPGGKSSGGKSLILGLIIIAFVWLSKWSI